MQRQLPHLAPLGRLYDPLLGLAARVHRALGARPKTIWADERGGVFKDCADLPASKRPRSIVGTYDVNTSPCVIEDDLRLALRERASRWITDWNAKPSSQPQDGHRPNSGATAQGRSRRGRAAMTEMPKLDRTAAHEMGQPTA